MRRITLITLLVAAGSLAGCLSTVPAMDLTSEDGPGEGLVLRVEGNRSTIAPGEPVAFEVVVENRGDETVSYRDGCYTAWNHTLEGPSGDEVQAHRPGAICQGYGWQTLEPGEQVSYAWSAPEADFAWNGTTWNGSGWEEAEPGTYVLQANFAYKVGDETRFENRTVSGSDEVEVRERDDGPYDSLEVSAEADREEIAPGEEVQVDLAVRNTGNRTVWFNDVCRADWTVDVLDASGEPVQYTPYRARCMALAWTRLEPGESHRYSLHDQEGFTWNGTAWHPTDPDDDEFGNGSYEPVADGEYTVRGAFRYALERGGEIQRISGAEAIQVRSDDDASSQEGSVEVEASASPSEIEPGETTQADFEATNTGNSTVERREGCGHDWEITVHDPSGDEVQVRKPRARCMGYSWVPLEPGESHGGGLTWNGTVWNGSAYEEAPEGNYTIRGAFAHDPGRDRDPQVARGETTVRVTG